MLTTYVSDPTRRPYEDDPGRDGYQRYKWQGIDPNLAANRSLRTAMDLGKPLIWLFGVAPGTFRVFAPVWLIAEERDDHQFVLAVDEDTRDQWAAITHPVDLALRREYVEAVVRRRVHQPVFRDRVLFAYRHQCALCRLRHPKLLDAAHIREDSAGGEPVVPNGISMCAIHHRAFDADIIGLRPDYIVEVRQDVLAETDGPTLQHALQGMHRAPLFVPKQRRAQPDPALLEERYERFRLAG
jgi:putative restriction endonuclease